MLTEDSSHLSRTSSLPTALVSVTSGGVQGDMGSDSPAMSADGRYVTFRSPATNLAPGADNGQSDVFVRDLVDKTTSLVSRTAGTELSNGRSARPSISGDGRYIAFESQARNLVANDANGTAADILLRPANDYVAEFVKHMNPLDVLTAEAVMRARRDLPREGDAVVLDAASGLRLTLDACGRPEAGS